MKIYHHPVSMPRVHNFKSIPWNIFLLFSVCITIMSSDRETNALLNLVSYTVRENSLPTELCLAPELANLLNKELPTINFTLAQTVPCSYVSISVSLCYSIILTSNTYCRWRRGTEVQKRER